jgi:S-formylglutathione hydrolase FrmB
MNYRVLADPAHRAIAGLSMGGAQTLNVAFADLDEYGYIGVFSSGIFGIAGGFGGAAPNTQWEERERREAIDHQSGRRRWRPALPGATRAATGCIDGAS